MNNINEENLTNDMLFGQDLNQNVVDDGSTGTGTILSALLYPNDTRYVSTNCTASIYYDSSCTNKVDTTTSSTAYKSISVSTKLYIKVIANDNYVPDSDNIYLCSEGCSSKNQFSIISSNSATNTYIYSGTMPGYNCYMYIICKEQSADKTDKETPYDNNGIFTYTLTDEEITNINNNNTVTIYIYIKPDNENISFGDYYNTTVGTIIYNVSTSNNNTNINISETSLNTSLDDYITISCKLSKNTENITFNNSYFDINIDWTYAEDDFQSEESHNEQEGQDTITVYLTSTTDTEETEETYDYYPANYVITATTNAEDGYDTFYISYDDVKKMGSNTLYYIQCDISSQTDSGSTVNSVINNAITNGGEYDYSSYVGQNKKYNSAYLYLALQYLIYSDNDTNYFSSYLHNTVGDADNPKTWEYVPNVNNETVSASSPNIPYINIPVYFTDTTPVELDNNTSWRGANDYIEAEYNVEAAVVSYSEYNSSNITPSNCTIIESRIIKYDDATAKLRYMFAESSTAVEKTVTIKFTSTYDGITENTISTYISEVPTDSTSMTIIGSGDTPGKYTSAKSDSDVITTSGLTGTGGYRTLTATTTETIWYGLTLYSVNAANSIENTSSSNNAVTVKAVCGKQSTSSSRLIFAINWQTIENNVDVTIDINTVTDNITFDVIYNNATETNSDNNYAIPVFNIISGISDYDNSKILSVKTLNSKFDPDSNIDISTTYNTTDKKCYITTTGPTIDKDDDSITHHKYVRVSFYIKNSNSTDSITIPSTNTDSKLNTIINDYTTGKNDMFLPNTLFESNTYVDEICSVNLGKTVDTSTTGIPTDTSIWIGYNFCNGCTNLYKFLPNDYYDNISRLIIVDPTSTSGTGAFYNCYNLMNFMSSLAYVYKFNGSSTCYIGINAFNKSDGTTADSSAAAYVRGIIFNCADLKFNTTGSDYTIYSGYVLFQNMTYVEAITVISNDALTALCNVLQTSAATQNPHSISTTNTGTTPSPHKSDDVRIYCVYSSAAYSSAHTQNFAGINDTWNLYDVPSTDLKNITVKYNLAVTNYTNNSKSKIEYESFDIIDPWHYCKGLRKTGVIAINTGNTASCVSLDPTESINTDDYPNNYNIYFGITSYSDCINKEYIDINSSYLGVFAEATSLSISYLSDALKNASNNIITLNLSDTTADTIGSSSVSLGTNTNINNEYNKSAIKKLVLSASGNVNDTTDTIVFKTAVNGSKITVDNDKQIIIAFEEGGTATFDNSTSTEITDFTKNITSVTFNYNYNVGNYSDSWTYTPSNSDKENTIENVFKNIFGKQATYNTNTTSTNTTYTPWAHTKISDAYKNITNICINGSINKYFDSITIHTYTYNTFSNNQYYYGLKYYSAQFSPEMYSPSIKSIKLSGKTIKTSTTNEGAVFDDFTVTGKLDANNEIVVTVNGADITLNTSDNNIKCGTFFDANEQNVAVELSIEDNNVTQRLIITHDYSPKDDNDYKNNIVDIIGNISCAVDTTNNNIELINAGNYTFKTSSNGTASTRITDISSAKNEITLILCYTDSGNTIELGDFYVNTSYEPIATTLDNINNNLSSGIRLACDYTINKTDIHRNTAFNIISNNKLYQVNELKLTNYSASSVIEYTCTSETTDNPISDISAGDLGGTSTDTVFCRWYENDHKGIISLSSGNSITNIPKDMFKNENITYINIPDSVTSIGNNAFYGCTKLTSINIPDSVTSIGNNAFYGCTGLTSITIPDSVKEIGTNVFDGCTGLKSISFGTGLISLSNYICNNCSALTSINIPDNITSIGDNSFAGCSALTTISFLNKVTTIGESAFKGCDKVKSLVIPATVSTIGDNAFASCDDLEQVTVNVTSTDNLKNWSLTAFDGLTNSDNTKYITCNYPQVKKSLLVTNGIFGSLYWNQWIMNIDTNGIADITTLNGEQKTSYKCYVGEYRGVYDGVNEGNDITKFPYTSTNFIQIKCLSIGYYKDKDPSTNPSWGLSCLNSSDSKCDENGNTTGSIDLSSISTGNLTQTTISGEKTNSGTISGGEALLGGTLFGGTSNIEYTGEPISFENRGTYSTVYCIADTSNDSHTFTIKYYNYENDNNVKPKYCDEGVTYTFNCTTNTQDTSPFKLTDITNYSALNTNKGFTLSGLAIDVDDNKKIICTLSADNDTLTPTNENYAFWKTDAAGNILHAVNPSLGKNITLYAIYTGNTITTININDIIYYKNSSGADVLIGRDTAKTVTLADNSINIKNGDAFGTKLDSIKYIDYNTTTKDTNCKWGKTDGYLFADNSLSTQYVNNTVMYGDKNTPTTLTVYRKIYAKVYKFSITKKSDSTVLNANVFYNFNISYTYPDGYYNINNTIVGSGCWLSSPETYNNAVYAYYYNDTAISTDNKFEDIINIIGTYNTDNTIILSEKWRYKIYLLLSHAYVSDLTDIQKVNNLSNDTDIDPIQNVNYMATTNDSTKYQYMLINLANSDYGTGNYYDEDSNILNIIGEYFAKNQNLFKTIHDNFKVYNDIEHKTADGTDKLYTDDGKIFYNITINSTSGGYYSSNSIVNYIKLDNNSVLINFEDKTTTGWANNNSISNASNAEYAQLDSPIMLLLNWKRTLLSIQNDEKIIVSFNRCNQCGRCAEACPVNAIKMKNIVL